MSEELKSYEARLTALKKQRERLLDQIKPLMESGSDWPCVEDLMAELAEVDSEMQNLWEPTAERAEASLVFAYYLISKNSALLICSDVRFPPKPDVGSRVMR